MNYFKLSNIMAERKRKLGMSEAYLARRSGVSQSVVHRILSGQHKKAAYEDVMAIAEYLGMRTQRVRNGINIFWDNISEMRERRAEMLAVVTASLTQSTSGLEEQGVDKEEIERLKQDYKNKFLSGPNKDLWGDD